MSALAPQDAACAYAARVRRCGAIAGALALLLAGCQSDNGPRGAETTTTGSYHGSVHVVSQNLLHGLGCPERSDHCAAGDRVALFARQIEESGCPDVVALQEVNTELVGLLSGELTDRCDSGYDIVWDDDRGADREAVLTTLTVVASRRLDLAGPLRTALWVRVASPVGLVDLATTHLASSSDDRPCDARTCPPPCLIDDALGTCQARQVVDFLEENRLPSSVVVLAGDLNARPGEPTIDAISGFGYIDTHLAAGNSECDPTTGTQCTSGRDDSSLAALRGSPRAQTRQSERIDYVFYSSGSAECDVARPTGLFHPEPRKDGPGGLAYVSDHTGVQAALSCRVSATDLAEMGVELRSAYTSVPEVTATANAAEVDDATTEAITSAFETVFDGDIIDIDAKIATIENGDALRPSFVERYESLGDLVARTRVEVDDIRPVDADHAEVTYSIFLNDTVVLDRLAGGAIRQDGRWLVSTRTYCDVSTQGQAEIPEPCR